jgi:hypothetical protein
VPRQDLTLENDEHPAASFVVRSFPSATMYVAYAVRPPYG